MEAIAELLKEKTNRNPDRNWLSKLAGEYVNEDLGHISIRLTKNGAIFDSGQWQCSIGRKKEDDGTIKLVLTDVPKTWLEMTPEENNGKMTLVLVTPQQKYVFAPFSQAPEENK